jgi:hypothetical protein
VVISALWIVTTILGFVLPTLPFKRLVLVLEI